MEKSSSVKQHPDSSWTKGPTIGNGNCGYYALAEVFTRIVRDNPHQLSDALLNEQCHEIFQPFKNCLAQALNLNEKFSAVDLQEKLLKQNGFETNNAEFIAHKIAPALMVLNFSQYYQLTKSIGSGLSEQERDNYIEKFRSDIFTSIESSEEQLEAAYQALWKNASAEAQAEMIAFREGADNLYNVLKQESYETIVEKYQLLKKSIQSPPEEMESYFSIIENSISLKVSREKFMPSVNDSSLNAHIAALTAKGLPQDFDSIENASGGEDFATLMNNILLQVIDMKGYLEINNISNILIPLLFKPEIDYEKPNVTFPLLIVSEQQLTSVNSVPPYYAVYRRLDMAHFEYAISANAPLLNQKISENPSPGVKLTPLSSDIISLQPTNPSQSPSGLVASILHSSSVQEKDEREAQEQAQQKDSSLLPVSAAVSTVSMAPNTANKAKLLPDRSARMITSSLDEGEEEYDDQLSILPQGETDRVLPITHDDSETVETPSAQITGTGTGADTRKSIETLFTRLEQKSQKPSAHGITKIDSTQSGQGPSYRVGSVAIQNSSSATLSSITITKIPEVKSSSKEKSIIAQCLQPFKNAKAAVNFNIYDQSDLQKLKDFITQLNEAQPNHTIKYSFNIGNYIDNTKPEHNTINALISDLQNATDSKNIPDIIQQCFESYPNPMHISPLTAGSISNHPDSSSSPAIKRTKV